jgi:dTDP-4-dehydrorhamnose 3,5-epimerase-like enzyme
MSAAPVNLRSLSVRSAREARLIQLPRFTDHRGSLSPVEWPGCLPFTPKRFYYVYDLPEGARRGGHAHWSEDEVVLALNGRFRVLLDDGRVRREFDLDRPDTALYVPSLVWHELYDFTAGAVCAVFSSDRYDSEDFCRDYQLFLKTSGNGT